MNRDGYAGPQSCAFDHKILVSFLYLFLTFENDRLSRGLTAKR